MPIISVPSSNSVIYKRFREAEENMLNDVDWQENYEKQKLIKEIMLASGFHKMAAFWMLCQIHEDMGLHEPEELEKAN